MSRHFGTFSILLMCLSFFFSGCASQKTPDLLTIDRLDPETLEADTDLHIEGNGFPENRRGILTLEGVAYTPARPPRHVTWELPLVADSRTSITVRIEQRNLHELTQGASHVTFRGSARVHFSPLVEGRPPLRGRQEGLVLDLFVPHDGENERVSSFLAFLGVELTPELTIKELLADSIADNLGLQEGDHLHTLDGVRLDSVQDFLPQAHAKTSVLEYSREGFRGTATVQIPRSQFQLLDHALGARALAVLAGVALALLGAARPPRFLLWLFGAKSRARRGKVLWLPGVGERSQTLAYPTFLVVVLAFWWMLSDRGLDLIGLELVGAVSLGSLLLLAAAFLLGGRKSRDSSFSLLGAFASTCSRLLILLPIVVGALSRASTAGSLRLSEMAERQGAWPAAWALFESPFTFLIGVAYLVALVPLSGRRAPLEGNPGNSSTGLVLARLSEWTGMTVLLGLWVALFLGAALSPTQSIVIGGILFSTKVAIIAHVLAWVRARSGHLRIGESWGLFGVANLAMCFLAAAMTFGSVVYGVHEAHAELLGLFSAALACSLLVLFFISSQRSWAHMGRRIDPWI